MTAPGTAARAPSHAIVVASVVLLVVLGGPAAPTPMVSSPAAFARWWLEREPLTATLGVLRWLAIVAGTATLTRATLRSLAEITRAEPLASLLDATSPAQVRRVVSGVLGMSIGLAGSAAASGGSHPADRPDAPHAVQRRIDEGEPGLVLRRVPLADERDTVDGDGLTLRRVPAEEADRRRAPDETWTVECGDHLWSIASTVLSDAWGRPPTDDEVDPYWRILIARNRDRLLVPSNSDLLQVGQVLELAPVPSPPS